MKDGEDGDGDNRVEPGAVRRPGLLDGGFRDALEALKDRDEEEVEDKGMDIAEWPAWTLTRPVQSVNGGLWTVSDIMAPEAGPGAAEQMAAIAKKIQEILNAAAQEAAGRTTGDIIFTTVLLRSMADFPLMNSIYISLFKKPNPPARATVACGDCLPHGVDVVVSMVIDLGARVQRNGLHVQSRSYWAPANIGPYSQAISVPLQGTEKVIYIAGQIPLEPASMELIETSHGCGEPSWSDTYRLRAVLSLQHMWRIGVAMEVCWWLGTVAFFTGKEHTKTRARLAWKLWEKMHKSAQEPEEEEESTLDAWDIKYGRRGHEQIKPIMGPRLPDFDLVKTDSLDHVPAFFAVQVHELPRNSDIEWQGLGYRCEGVKMTKRATESGRVIEVTTNQRLMYSCIELDREIPDLKGRLQRLLEAYGPSNTHCIIYSSQPLSRDCFPGQVVPCKSVWGAEGRELAAGVIIQRQT
ncbi:hypothetical protein BJX61DRAFT_545278 [Aspergillus egyptiacus]|nr:hypothetical protein BJX61DRAFT_545278 [Aspergillus egyptiacus]